MRLAVAALEGGLPMLVEHQRIHSITFVEFINDVATHMELDEVARQKEDAEEAEAEARDQFCLDPFPGEGGSVCVMPPNHDGGTAKGLHSDGAGRTW